MSNEIPDAAHRLSSLGVPDYYVWVTVDGKVAPVHSVKHDTENKVSCYIETKEGKPFAVHIANLRTTSPPHSFVHRLHVDGQYCHGGLTRQGHDLYSEGLSYDLRFSHFMGRKTSATTLQPFLFGKLESTDDDNEACPDEHRIKAVGTIGVKYVRIENIRRYAGTSTYLVPTAPAKIHEKSKKARLSHQAIFGPDKSVEEEFRSTFDWIDKPESPFLEFEFMYRSRQLLQFEGYLPETPHPSRHPSPTSPPPSVKVKSDCGSVTPRRRLDQLRRELESLEKEVEVLENTSTSRPGLASQASSRAKGSKKRLGAEKENAGGAVKKPKTVNSAPAANGRSGSSADKGIEGAAEVIYLGDSDDE
ncbi:hypothetical protein JCM10212_001760 [Sporobolomyces blumeae]